MKTTNPVLKTLRDYGIITLGCAIYAFAFDWCFAPNYFSFGGLTGISQIINAFFPALPVGVMIIVLNIPLFILGLIFLGRRALVSSLYAMIVSSLMLDGIAALYAFPAMDPLLACIYGGALMGASGGLMLLVNTTTGGTELAARLLKFPFPHLPIGKLCLAIDVAVVCLYAAVFQSVHTALYGIVALYISSLAMDYVVYGSRVAQVAYIISDCHEAITAKLLEMDRGVTLLDGEGAYAHTEKKVILVALKRSQIVPVKLLVREIDPDAFVIVCKANEVLGEGFGEYTKNSL